MWRRSHTTRDSMGFGYWSPLLRHAAFAPAASASSVALCGAGGASDAKRLRSAPQEMRSSRRIVSLQELEGSPATAQRATGPVASVGWTPLQTPSAASVRSVLPSQLFVASTTSARSVNFPPVRRRPTRCTTKRLQAKTGFRPMGSRKAALDRRTLRCLGQTRRWQGQQKRGRG